MRHSMTNENGVEKWAAPAAASPTSGSSLEPMLVSGLVLIVIGMIAVAAFN
jgi:hypothetical protein